MTFSSPVSPSSSDRHLRFDSTFHSTLTVALVFISVFILASAMLGNFALVWFLVPFILVCLPPILILNQRGFRVAARVVFVIASCNAK
jgi:hypothetical protein